MSNQYIGVEDKGFANATGSNAAVQAAEQKAKDAKQAYDKATASVEDYKSRLRTQNNELKSLLARRSKVAQERNTALTEKQSLADTRYQEGSKAERGDGTKCAKGGFRLGDGYDNGCLSLNKNRQAALQNTADEKQRQYNNLTTEIRNQEKVIQETEGYVNNWSLQLIPLQTNYKNAQAALENAKALNNAEALKARAELAEAERRKEAEVQQKKNELEAIKAEVAKRQLQARLKEGLIDQESQALQASADLQRSSMPMVIGFVGLVIISFIIQPMLKKKN